jgi:hypothetical protein
MLAFYSKISLPYLMQLDSESDWYWILLKSFLNMIIIIYRFDFDKRLILFKVLIINKSSLIDSLIALILYEIILEPEIITVPKQAKSKRIRNIFIDLTDILIESKIARNQEDLRDEEINN